MDKTIRVEVAMPENIALQIESEYHRLHQELINLKKKGLIAKSVRLHQTDVLRVIILLGLEEIHKVGIEGFRKTILERLQKLP